MNLIINCGKCSCGYLPSASNPPSEATSSPSFPDARTLARRNTAVRSRSLNATVCWSAAGRGDQRVDSDRIQVIETSALDGLLVLAGLPTRGQHHLDFVGFSSPPIMLVSMLVSMTDGKVLFLGPASATPHAGADKINEEGRGQLRALGFTV